MKKYIFFYAVILVLCCISCERKTYLAVDPCYIIVQVGDTTSFETHHVKEKYVSFSMAGQQDDPMAGQVCKLEKQSYDPYYSERIIMKVIALNPGRDTIHIDYQYKVGTTKYYDKVLIPVWVKEKDEEEE